MADTSLVNVEICINCDILQQTKAQVSAAYQGGATTVELCRAMDFDGLTPTKEHIVAARQSFKRPGLMVMIRPRSGDFTYSKNEIDQMKQSIALASEVGADGIVFGALAENHLIHQPISEDLVAISQSYNLKTTFHRAFDATPDLFESLETLITLGVDRVLTSGTPWTEKKTAWQGRQILKRLIQQAQDQIEIVIGGGITLANVQTIIGHPPPSPQQITVHAYSGVQEAGITTVNGVKALVEATQLTNRRI